MADVVHRPVSAQILNKNRGQRIQILTFSGETFINTRWVIASNFGPPVQTHVRRQQLSNGILPDRDEDDPATNGHFTVDTDT